MVTNSSILHKVEKSVSLQSNVRKKHWLFISVNALVMLLVIAALALNPNAQLGIGIYVIILFVLCSLPSLFMANYRGKASLMLMFLAYYFGAFGLLDLSNLISFSPLPPRSTRYLFTEVEIVILIGAAAFMTGYVLAGTFISEHNSRFLKREWSLQSIALIGIIAWAIGFYSNGLIQLGIGDQFTQTKHNLGAFGGFIALSRMLGPLGFLMLVYSFLTTKNKLSLFVLICMMLGDFALGFVGDSKETAIRDPLLFLFSYVILRERVPVVLTVIFVVAAGLSFNYFAAYRDELGTRHESRASGLSKIDSKLSNIVGQDKPLSERFVEGLEYFSSRITLKQNVELLVSRVGKDKEFLEGYTLKPLLFAFIPRFILPDKQNTSMVGQLFNREFQISGSRDTYISVSMLGELYWNFGYKGIVFGMMCIGLTLAYVAGLAAGSNINLPRYLLLLLTVYLLVLRSESSVAMTFTYWARTVVLLFIIHMLMPKDRTSTPVTKPSSTASITLTVAKTPFTKPSVKL